MVPLNAAKMFDLKGRVAIVTGGAGILGRRIAMGLASCGADVACLDLDLAACESVSSALRTQYAVRSCAVQCDLREAAAIENAVAGIERDFGPIDVLINNAASKTQSVEDFLTPLEDYEQSVWQDVMSVNLQGAFFMARSVGKRMAERGAGSIVQVASIYGLLAPDQRIYEGSEYLGRRINTPPVYSASKAGVIGLTKHLASYWAHRGVRVNTLTPGGVESGQNETFKAKYAARVPLGRMAAPDELVGPVVFLVSPAASYITGQNLVVDGGLSSW